MLRQTMLAATILIVVGGCHARPKTQARAAPGEQIAWREGAVDDALAAAKAQRKPLLLYWGAKWCPPCNMMKQTLFKDPVFIAQTRAFIPVHLDGDSKDAQVWAGRFHTGAYPTVLVLRPDGTEITRLSGASSATQLSQVLSVAATRRSSLDDLLKRAEDPARLSHDDWRLLASYDPSTDAQHFPDPVRQAAFNARLAAAAPDQALRRRFTLEALLAQASDAGKLSLTPAQQQEAQATLAAILASPAEVAADRLDLVYGGASLVEALPASAQRQMLQTRLVAAMDRVGADAQVPLAVRVYAAETNVAFAKASNGGRATPAVLALARERVATADREAHDPSTRQSVMPLAGQLLADAGDGAGAEQVWKAELPRAIAPYYYMADIGAQEQADKHPAAAIAWMKQAAESAQGPATRLQWAIDYSTTVIVEAPDNTAAVLASADMVLDRIKATTAGLDGRSHQEIVKWRAAVAAWGVKQRQRAAVIKIDAKLSLACGAADCDGQRQKA